MDILASDICKAGRKKHQTRSGTCTQSFMCEIPIADGFLLMKWDTAGDEILHMVVDEMISSEDVPVLKTKYIVSSVKQLLRSRFDT